MDQIKVGALIRELRKEKNMTQKEVASLLSVSDRAVSKWERGIGCPDVSLLPLLSDIFSVDLKTILDGVLTENSEAKGNMKKVKHYVCPVCGNIIISTDSSVVKCCSRVLLTLNEEKAKEEERLKVERIDHSEFYISSSHPMTKDDYISFVSYATSENVLIRRLYPEWDLSFRMPFLGRGKIFWYSKSLGLKYMLI